MISVGSLSHLTLNKLSLREVTGLVHHDLMSIQASNLRFRTVPQIKLSKGPRVKVSLLLIISYAYSPLFFSLLTFLFVVNMSGKSCPNLDVLAYVK